MARLKKIQAVDLSSAVADLLDEYGEEVYDHLGVAIEETAEKAAKDLRSVKKFSEQGHPTGVYSAGWTQEQTIRGRTSLVRVVYNQDYPQYAHLLEFGHANRGGGRTEGFTHIKPVNDWVQDEIVRAVEKAVKA